MAYVALYRQWRPRLFGEVVGQGHVSQTLKNAIKYNRIVHAYLFTGPRGTGKTSSAKILAKAVNCLAPEEGEACNRCDSCLRINQGNSMDVIEIDAASNRGIDEIRDLREKVKYAPVESRYKVYIIDEVHMLTAEAFNALLKTLEEPPKHVIFVLATTEPHKVPITVLSRCQRFDFKRIGYGDVEARLQEIIANEGLQVSERAVRMIARKAEGSMRDALSLLDQCLSFTDGEITEEIITGILGTVDADVLSQVVQAMAEKNLVSILQIVESLVNDGKDLRQFLNDLLEYFRNLLLVKLSPDGESAAGLPDYVQALLKKQCHLLPEKQLFFMMQVLGETESILKFSAQPRITLEIGLIKATGFHAFSREEIPVEKCVSREETIDSSTGDEKGPAWVFSKELETEGPAGTVDLEAVRENWKKVLDAVRKQKISTYAYLVEGEPVAVEGRKIKLIFKPQYQLHMETLHQSVHKNLVEKSLSQVFNQQLTVEGKLAEDQGQKDNLIEDAKKLFGENLVEIKE